MEARLVFAIISTLLEEIALAAIGLYGLPQLGIPIPLPAVVAVMALWLGYSVFVYRKGSLALKRGLIVGLPDMVGGEGEVVCPLAPEGLVMIKGELWVAKSESGEMRPREKVVVVGQERLKLLVRASAPSGDSTRTG